MSTCERCLGHMKWMPYARRDDLCVEAVHIEYLDDVAYQVHARVVYVIEPPNERRHISRAGLRGEERLVG